MSQFDKITDVLGYLQQVAHQLAEQGDSLALRDLYLTLHETFDHFGMFYCGPFFWWGI